jgi:DNA-binding MarR family transcriptional regulator
METAELSSALRTFVSLMHKELRKQISKACTYSMTELQTISLLSQNKQLLPSQLASLTRIKMQSMSQILKKFENDKIIQKTPCQKDKRKTYISLTPFGKEVVKEVRKSKDEWLKNTIDETLSAQEKESLQNLLPILEKLIEKE